MGWVKKLKTSRASSSVSSSGGGGSSTRSDEGSLNSSSNDDGDGKAHIHVCARIRPIAVHVERQGFFEDGTSAQPPSSGLRPPASSKLKTPSSKPGFFKRVTRKAPLPSNKNQSSKNVGNDFVAWDVNAEGDTASQSTKTNRIQGRTHAYTLDRVYGGNSTTRDVYDNTIHQLVKDAMEGYHSSILSYGQTSTGKTFTMSGTTESPGLIPLSIKDCFRYLNEISEEREYLIRLSYLEVYKEHIRDLLASTPQPIRLFENKTDGLIIRGCKEEVVTEPEQVFRLLKEGESRRQVGATNMNQHSSRSHTLVRLWIESHSAGSASRVSSLTMVDLAGSESVRLNGTARREEGQYINKSLMTLGQVVLSLSEGVKGHIPYRDSKLTRLLQPSLSGNARMVLLCCIHPIASHLEESHNTFKFATRAKKIKQKAVINVTADEKTLLQNYRDEIDDLKQQLKEAREQQRQLLEARASGNSADNSTTATYNSNSNSTTTEQDENEAASDEVVELMEAIQSMERLILKSRPNETERFKSPERTETKQNDDMLDDLLADDGIRETPTPSNDQEQNDDEQLQNELQRIRGLVGSVLQRRHPTTETTTSTPNEIQPVTLNNQFVETLQQQLLEQEATTNLSKADSSFLQSQLQEKDQLLEEVSKILEALEQRQTVLENENMELRNEVQRLRRRADI